MNGIRDGKTSFSGVLVDGTAVTYIMAGAKLPATVWVEPNVATSDQVTVTYKVGQNDVGAAWPSGPVVARAENSLTSPIYSITFQRTAGTSALSRFGVAQ